MLQYKNPVETRHMTIESATSIEVSGDLHKRRFLSDFAGVDNTYYVTGLRVEVTIFDTGSPTIEVSMLLLPANSAGTAPDGRRAVIRNLIHLGVCTDAEQHWYAEAMRYCYDTGDDD